MEQIPRAGRSPHRLLIRTRNKHVMEVSDNLIPDINDPVVKVGERRMRRQRIAERSHGASITNDVSET